MYALIYGSYFYITIFHRRNVSNNLWGPLIVVYSGVIAGVHVHPLKPSSDPMKNIIPLKYTDLR